MKIAVVGVAPPDYFDPSRFMRNGAAWEFAGVNGGQQSVVLRWRDARGVFLEIELARTETTGLVEELESHFQCADIEQGVAEQFQRMLSRSEN